MCKVAFWTACLFCGILFANSLHLNNNSPHYLMVKIIAADQTLLGETVMGPQTWNDWSDEDLLDSGTYAPQWALTPYTVHWFCLDGGDFSVCNGVSTGSTIAALNCGGSCQCKTKKIERNQGQPKADTFDSPPQYPPQADEESTESSPSQN